MLDENCPIEEVRELFGNDRFATEACGCRVLEASRGHAVCAFDIAPIHLNAMGNVMGGAIFTLADFALAIACNMGEDPTVAVNNTIEYLNSTKGSTLIATCDADKPRVLHHRSERRPGHSRRQDDCNLLQAQLIGSVRESRSTSIRPSVMLSVSLMNASQLPYSASIAS